MGARGKRFASDSTQAKACGYNTNSTTKGTMKLGLINSAFQQVGMDTATGLKHISRIGFDSADIFTEAVGISKKEVSLVANTASKLGLPIVSLPVVAVGLIDFNGP